MELSVAAHGYDEIADVPEDPMTASWSRTSAVQADVQWVPIAASNGQSPAWHKEEARSEDRASPHVRREGLEPPTRGLRVHCSAS